MKGVVMDYETTTRKGKRFVLVPEDDFKRLAADLVPLPPAAADGTRDALAFARASIANSIITGRKALGWTQSELSRQAKVPLTTLNLIENAKRTADQSTIERIERAIRRGTKAQSKSA
jgi:ribosome-binding protein aMBF1 (putative translation factor)